VARLARRVWGLNGENEKELALSGIAAFRAFLQSIGLSTSMESIGAKKEDVPTLVDMLFDGRDYTIGNYLPLTREHAAAIYTLAFEN